VALAKEFGADLHICHVIDLSSVAIYGEFQLDPVGQQDRIMEDANTQLEELAGDQSVAWEPLITVGKPADEISRAVEDKDIDLVITATRGRSGFKRLILGSVTERLMRTLSCPLLVVRSHEHAFVNQPKQEIKLQKILVGCDFSPDSGQAFAYGLSLAQEFMAELHLAHVIEPPAQPNLIKEEALVPGEIQEEYHDLLIQKLKDMVPDEAANWCTPQTSIMEGQPHDELVKYAHTRDIDMIVLGVRGHGLVKTLFLGSTTDRVIRNSPCPVLSVSSKVQKE
jgi:nucleotide-binding universal stress UspA family protein